MTEQDAENMSAIVFALNARIAELEKQIEYLTKPLFNMEEFGKTLENNIMLRKRLALYEKPCGVCEGEGKIEDEKLVEEKEKLQDEGVYGINLFDTSKPCPTCSGAGTVPRWLLPEWFVKNLIGFGFILHYQDGLLTQMDATKDNQLKCSITKLPDSDLWELKEASE